MATGPMKQLRQIQTVAEDGEMVICGIERKDRWEQQAECLERKFTNDLFRLSKNKENI